MDCCGVNSKPHDISPSFGGHHGEHSEHGPADIIEIRLVGEPLTAVIVTVPLRLDPVMYLQGNVCHIAVIHLSFEKEDTLDSKYHQQKQGDAEQVYNAWDRVEQRNDLDFETKVALQHSEGP